jgi:hypothetical protein
MRADFLLRRLVTSFVAVAGVITITFFVARVLRIHSSGPVHCPASFPDRTRPIPNHLGQPTCRLFLRWTIVIHHET